MGQIVTLDLPADVAQRARAVAAHTRRPVEDVLLEWIGRAATDVPLETLPDDQVLALSELVMGEADQQEMSELLASQREGTLNNAARLRLDALLGLYRRGLIQKSQALKVAVERGLRPPLDASEG
ncbi:MAG TPA: hypothetical protein VGR57_02810 [Ktedonobacterales bacterium]|nr:hypothetical protein [Ktedonobacterales bacterium]